MPHPMTRTNAVLTTQITRAVAVVVGIGAVALGLAGLPGRAAPPPGSTLPSVAPPGAPAAGSPAARVTPVSFAPVDAGGLAARFAMLDNAPKVPDAVGVTVNTDTGPVRVEPVESPAAGGIADRVRFLGVVRLGDRNAAFINIDGRQRFVQEGARLPPPADRPEFPELLVERVMGAVLVISDGQRRERLSVADRTGPSVTMADGGVIDRVEAPTEPEPLNRRELPQEEMDRRSRMLERQRGGNLGENSRGRAMPDTVNRAVSPRARPAAAQSADE